MSSSVFSCDRLKRRLPWAISWGSPIDNSTCDGSKDALVQAEPDEAQMPSTSSHNNKLSPSIKGMEMLTFPGNLCSRSPFNLA